MTQLEEGGGHVLCVIMTQCVRKSICNIQLKGCSLLEADQVPH